MSGADSPSAYLWKTYWGSGPLPAGAEALGVVTDPRGQHGALLKVGFGTLVRGNAGALAALPAGLYGCSVALLRDEKERLK
ncbi:MAG: hypothetical protein PHO89_11715 [Methylacidiphilaceae bacterium]|nr:hypothetical protein [Candidatus Methylacidiphilaceae bacterium]